MTCIMHYPDLFPCHNFGTVIQEDDDDVSVACIDDHSSSAKVLNAAQGVGNYSSVTPSYGTYVHCADIMQTICVSSSKSLDMAADTGFV